MEWIRINPYHRPDIGHALFATFNPEESGTLYYVVSVDEAGFHIESRNTNGVEIPPDQRKTFYISYELIPLTNLHVWDRHRDANYE